MLLLSMMDIPLHCINEAAVQFHLPAKLIIAVLETERGKVGQISRNKNGTYDIGPMQINSIFLPELKKYHITQWDILFDNCINIKVGAWILGKKIAGRDSLLKGVGDYHSATPWFNQEYYKKIKVKFTKLGIALQKNE